MKTSLMKRSIAAFIITSSITVLSMGCSGTRTLGKLEPISLSEPDSSAKAKALDHYLSGTVSEQAGDFQTAVFEYQLAMYYDPSSIELPQALSRLFLQVGEVIPAKRVLEQALIYHPRDPDLLNSLGELKLRSGDMEGSAQTFKRLSKVKPLSREETLRQVVLLERSGKLDEALELTGEYIKKFGEDPVIYERIGLIYVAKQDFDAADTAFQKLIKLDPKNDKIYYVLGGFRVARDDFAGAAGYFQKAVEIEPGEVRYWANLIMAVGREEKEDTLSILLNDAIRIFPDVPQFYDNRAGIRQHNKDWDGALEDAEKSAAIDSTRLSPYLAIGFICHQKEDWQRSEDAYKRALEISPDSPVVLNNYAYMLAVQGVRLEEALEYVNRALVASPGTPSYRDTKGWILHGLGREEEALSEIEASLKDDPENYEVYEHLSEVYKSLGKMDEAVKAKQRAEELQKMERP